jgi:hypothetical protein
MKKARIQNSGVRITPPSKNGVSKPEKLSKSPFHALKDKA